MRQYLKWIRFIIIITLIVFNAQQKTIIAQTGISDYFLKPKNGDTYVIAHRCAHNGIQTDNPQELIRFLSKRKKNNKKYY